MSDNRMTELLDGLRNVGNLHEFAELFGFDWYGDDDWTWHDVAVKMADDFEQAIAETLGSDHEAELIRAIEDVLRHSTDTVWAGESETLVDRMVSLGVYGHDVYEGARPWEADE